MKINENYYKKSSLEDFQKQLLFLSNMFKIIPCYL